MLKPTLLAVAAVTASAATASADVVSFTIDSSLSDISVGGTFAGDPGTSQFPGSDSSLFTGTLVADVLPGSISFPGGSSIDIIDQGTPVAPGPDALPFSTGVGDFGLNFDVFLLGIVPVAAYDWEFDLTSGSLAVDGAGNFDSSSLGINVLDGDLTFDAGLASGVVPLDGESTTNILGGATLVTVGSVQTLTIPIDTSLTFDGLQPDDSTITVTGNLVATRVIPEPATATVALLSSGLLLRRRR